MKIAMLACGAVALVSGTPVAAQSAPDDVQCAVLSAVFAQQASQEANKQVAARALAFYVGRLDARGNPQALKSQIAATKIDPKTAPASMTACAARLNQAARALLPGGSGQGGRR